MSAILLVGRLSWLMNVRGRFLEEALTPAASASSSSGSSLSEARGSTGRQVVNNIVDPLIDEDCSLHITLIKFILQLAIPNSIYM